MPKAVQISAYGGVDRLTIVEVPKPEPKAGEVLVRVFAAAINPGEISIREGLLKEMYPMDFPFGEGTDFAGRIETIGSAVSGLTIGDDVFGWSHDRNTHAEFLAVKATQVIAKPPSLDWYRAGSISVAGTTAFAAVRAVALKPGETVAISGAAGGVGSLATQLARRTGARVLAIASSQNASFLQSIGAEPVEYGDGLQERLTSLAPKGIDAFIDLFGQGYVDLAIGLGIRPDRIDTIIDFAAAGKYAIKAEGSGSAADAKSHAYVADLIAWGEIAMPIAALYPFANIREAFVELARRKTRGKIVLDMSGAVSSVVRPAASHA